MEENPVDVADEDPEELPVEAPLEDPTEEGYISPTPSLLSLDPEEENYEEYTPEASETEAGADHTPPPPPQEHMIPIAVYDWVVARLSAELTAAEVQRDTLKLQLAATEARLDESRFQLSAEREARHPSRNSVSDPNPRRMRREMLGIQARTRTRLRALPSTLDGLVELSEVELILTEAMMRTRDTTRSTRGH